MNARIERATVLFGMSRYADAEVELRAALADDPGDAIALAMLGIALCNQNRLLHADRATKAAIATDPTLGYAFYARSIVRTCKMEFSASLVTIQEALLLDGENADYLFALAHTLQCAERPTEALAAVNRALAVSPRNVECLTLRAQLLGKLRHLNEASKTFSTAVSLEPENAAVHFAQGRFMLLRGQNGPAMEHLLEARRLDPNHGLVVEAVALAIGRQMFPFRYLGRIIPHWYRWSLVSVWALFISLVIVGGCVARSFPPPSGATRSEAMTIYAALAWNFCLATVVFDFAAWLAARVLKRQAVGRPTRATVAMAVVLASLLALIEIGVVASDLVGGLLVLLPCNLTLNRLGLAHYFFGPKDQTRATSK